MKIREKHIKEINARTKSLFKAFVRRELIITVNEFELPSTKC